MAEFVLSAFADEASQSVEGQIAALVENGINYIEPRIVEGRGILLLEEEEIIDMKRKLDAAKIKVGSLGSPIGKFDIEECFEDQLVKFEKALRICEIFETKRMRIFSFYLPRERRSEYRDEVMKRLSKFVEIAAERGITICHENEANIYGQTPEDVEDILNTVKGIKGIFDPANYCVVGSDPVKGIDVTLPHLEYVHIKDALMDGRPETKDGMVIVAAGDGDGKIGEALDKINTAYDRTVILTLEPHLFNSRAFQGVDQRTLKGQRAFSNEREAFDAAVSAMRKLMKDYGYVEKDGKFTKG